MTLQEASKAFQVTGLNTAALTNQEEVFRAYLSFFQGIETIKNQNKRSTSHVLKDIFENSSPFGTLSARTHDYVYEGTVILAALASGLTMHQAGSGLTATFNIAERGLQRRVADLFLARIKQQKAQSMPIRDLKAGDTIIIKETFADYVGKKWRKGTTLTLKNCYHAAYEGGYALTFEPRRIMQLSDIANFDIIANEGKRYFTLMSQTETAS
jgi:hypothetical protein